MMRWMMECMAASAGMDVPVYPGPGHDQDPADPGVIDDLNGVSLGCDDELNQTSSLILLGLVDMDARGQNGIQLLLTAEQEAQQIVNAARNAKLARLKQAKEEAEKEVAEFRAQMEADFQRTLAETSGDSGANVKRLEKETEEKIQHLKTEADRISHDVVDMLLKVVTTVRY
ncbi:hypothetical protein E3N88_38246 [Mikania micrantha]|uniref:V-type proton ATPase subunit G n=1 Tax=Mikania micrantha TaxID=192012 RepID=A0A5N6LTJ0_9ASTR|nr:hypothetical protein E3N88_38246 [Mikania micrantha]